MAQHKIPQDVEAEDKLIGPFSFRQFIYLGIAALGGVVAFGLWHIFPGLIIITFPVIALFLVLALPLRKEQSMETYLTAVLRFYLKPRKRLWQPEGSIGLVTIVAPNLSVTQLTKSIGGAAASEQLSYLSQVVDTRGWATRGVMSPSSSMNDIAYAEAQNAEDVLDNNTNIARAFDSMIDKTSETHKQSIADQFRQAVRQPAPQPTAAQTPPTQAATPPTVANQPAPQAPVQAKPRVAPPMVGAPTAQPSAAIAPTTYNVSTDTVVDYNPYPNSMRQHVVSPLEDTVPAPAAVALTTPGLDIKPTPAPAQTAIPQNQPISPSREVVSPDIIRLANNNDLSISALANEARRIQDRDNEEVVINLH